MEEKYIVIGTTRFYHGDKISAVVNHLDDDFEIEDARLCINDFEKSGNDDELFNLYICQNECDGDTAAKEKFDYRYSWNFRVDTVNKKISSSDTSSIKLKENKEDREEDDDPMPEDWVCEEKFPEDI